MMPVNRTAYRRIEIYIIYVRMREGGRERLENTGLKRLVSR